MNTSLSFSLSALLSSAVLLGGAGCGAPGDSSAAGGDDTGNSGCGGDGTATTTTASGGAGGATATDTKTDTGTTTDTGAGGMGGGSGGAGGGAGGAGGSVSPGKMGMTWRKTDHDSQRGQDMVGCNTSCDAYVGDTLCTERRPILCIRKDGSESNGYVPDFYYGWAAGNIGLTPPVAGTDLTSLDAANAHCVETFGEGWEMAEFHDGGGGWAWRAYGNLDDRYNVSVVPYDENRRFWVHIDDQPANCWNP